jgi:2-methylcitrate dehydratase PrpD
MDATASLARFTHDLRVDDLPAGAIDACARLALDTVGAAIPAWDAPGVRELRALLAQWGRGPCRAWIAGERLPPPAATLVNSAMAHALEYDDLHCELPIHSGVVVVPAVLAVAETRQDASGADAAAAIVAGTEVMCWRVRPAAIVAMPGFAAGTRRRWSRVSARRPPPAACSASMPPASPAPWACPTPRRAATSSASRMAGW